MTVTTALPPYSPRANLLHSPRRRLSQKYLKLTRTWARMTLTLSTTRRPRPHPTKSKRTGRVPFPDRHRHSLPTPRPPLPKVSDVAAGFVSPPRTKSAPIAPIDEDRVIASITPRPVALSVRLLPSLGTLPTHPRCRPGTTCITPWKDSPREDLPRPRSVRFSSSPGLSSPTPAVPRAVSNRDS